MSDGDDKVRPHLSGPMARLAAGCVEPIYAAAVGVRNFAFDCGWIRVRRAGAAVISVGNLTAGGTGKTPMVIDIVRRLTAGGHTPAIVLRGYHADAAGLSDEAAVYAAALPGAVVVTNGDRVVAAKQIEREHPAVDVIVLDDAFQHRRIGRDLDVVLIDATDPFGGDAMLPLGLMREPARGLRRADAIVVTRADQVDDARRRAIDDRIERHAGRRPIAHAAHRWADVVDAADRSIGQRGGRVAVMCGIGNPAAFIRQAAARFEVVERRVFGDHHHYTAADVSGLGEADALLVTEKDWVKLRGVIESTPLKIPVWRPRLELAYLDGETELQNMILAAASRRSS